MDTQQALSALRRKVRKLNDALVEASGQTNPEAMETELEEVKAYAEQVATEAEELMETFYTPDGDKLEELP